MFTSSSRPLAIGSCASHFKVRGLVPPGSYSHMESQKRATFAMNKAGQGVGEQKKTASTLCKQGFLKLKAMLT
jgi:hypothetical protein